MSALPPVREDLRDFDGYRSARRMAATGEAWLNANESPWPSPADRGGRLRRYPDPQPAGLRDALAASLGCGTDELLLARGSDEAIDLVVRGFCAPGRDAVVVTPPVFGMYAVSARLQGARLLEVPLVEGDDDFRVDLDRVVDAALAGGARVVFVCSPGNPAGGVLDPARLFDAARRLAGSAMLVVDEAYIEFAQAPSAIARGRPDNLAVLRTLSKAHALAGARVGALVAAPAVVEFLRNCQAPYPVPGPSARLATAALGRGPLDATGVRVGRLCDERARLAAAIAALPCVRRVYPSSANFLLVRFLDAGPADTALRAAGIVVRDMRAMPQLGDALRITIGTARQNDAVVAALRDLPAGAA